MSIVIKGMDMPTSCSRCPCSNDASRFCRVVEEYIPMLGKPAFCPLIDVSDINVGDTIYRQAAIDDIKAMYEWHDVVTEDRLIEHMKGLPSAQPESLSDAYMKAVWTWLLNYQIKAAELEGRYTPYEVLSWVANDWRKENEIN